MAAFSEEIFILDLTSKREIVDSGRAAALLADVEHVRNPKIIKLSNKSITADAALIIAERLATFTELHTADISDIIAGRPEDEAIRVLNIICSSLADRNLLEVNVSDNAFGLKGVDACRSILTGKQTEKFYFNNNGLSAEAAQQLANIILDGGVVPPIKVLQFYNNMCGNGGAVAIASIVRHAVTMNEFRFSATRSSNDGCLSIAQSLTSISSLTKLDLSDNTFGEAAGLQLAEALKLQSGLVILNLRDSGLDGDAPEAILKTLSTHNRLLTSLDLSGNDLTSESCEAISNCLRSLSALRELSLDDNDIESEGAATIAAVLKDMHRKRTGASTSLNVLSLQTCSITAYGALKIARSVAKLPMFSTLKIDGNQLCGEQVPLLQKILRNAGKLIDEFEDNDDDGDDDADSAAEDSEDSEDSDHEDEATDGDDIDGLADAVGKVAI